VYSGRNRMRGAANPPPPLLFLVDGLQVALPAVDH
jgi:hypothetical protein